MTKDTNESVEIYVPKGYINEEETLFVSVGGKNYFVPRGKTSHVPVQVAREILRARRAEEKLDRSRERLIEDSAKPLGMDNAVL